MIHPSTSREPRNYWLEVVENSIDVVVVVVVVVVGVDVVVSVVVAAAAVVVVYYWCGLSVGGYPN